MARQYQEERYQRDYPDKLPDRFWEQVKVHERILRGDAHGYGQIHKMKRKKEYREEIQRIRHMIGIPTEGYSRRIGERVIWQWSQAFLDGVHRKRGSRKRWHEAAYWAFLATRVIEFAKRYPLTARRPMPGMIALEQIVYKRPRIEFVLMGYFEGIDKPIVLFDDALTKTPTAIARVVQYRRRGDNNELVGRVRIFNQHSNWGQWQISQNK